MGGEILESRVCFKDVGPVTIAESRNSIISKVRANRIRR